MAVDPAVLNLLLDQVVTTLQAAFHTGNYSQRPAPSMIRRKAPTPLDAKSDVTKPGGSVSVYCGKTLHSVEMNRRQQELQEVNVTVLVGTDVENQERVGIEYISDVQAIIVQANAWRVEVPATSGIVIVNFKPVMSIPTNANALPGIGGGRVMFHAKFSTQLGNPRRQP